MPSDDSGRAQLQAQLNRFVGEMSQFVEKIADIEMNTILDEYDREVEQALARSSCHRDGRPHHSKHVVFNASSPVHHQATNGPPSGVSAAEHKMQQLVSSILSRVMSLSEAESNAALAVHASLAPEQLFGIEGLRLLLEMLGAFVPQDSILNAVIATAHEVLVEGKDLTAVHRHDGWTSARCVVKTLLTARRRRTMGNISARSSSLITGGDPLLSSRKSTTALASGRSASPQPRKREQGDPEEPSVEPSSPLSERGSGAHHNNKALNVSRIFISQQMFLHCLRSLKRRQYEEIMLHQEALTEHSFADALEDIAQCAADTQGDAVDVDAAERDRLSARSNADPPLSSSRGVCAPMHQSLHKYLNDTFHVNLDSALPGVASPQVPQAQPSLSHSHSSSMGQFHTTDEETLGILGGERARVSTSKLMEFLRGVEPAHSGHEEHMNHTHTGGGKGHWGALAAASSLSPLRHKTAGAPRPDLDGASVPMLTLGGSGASSMPARNSMESSQLMASSGGIRLHPPPVSARLNPDNSSPTSQLGTTSPLPTRTPRGSIMFVGSPEEPFGDAVAETVDDLRHSPLSSRRADALRLRLHSPGGDAPSSPMPTDRSTASSHIAMHSNRSHTPLPRPESARDAKLRRRESVLRKEVYTKRLHLLKDKILAKKLLAASGPEQHNIITRLNKKQQPSDREQPQAGASAPSSVPCSVPCCVSVPCNVAPALTHPNWYSTHGNQNIYFRETRPANDASIASPQAVVSPGVRGPMLALSLRQQCETSLMQLSRELQEAGSIDKPLRSHKANNKRPATAQRTNQDDGQRQTASPYLRPLRAASATPHR